MGSLSQVLESRLADSLRSGIHHEEVAKLKNEIENAGLDKEKAETVQEELESSRKRQKDLQEDIDKLRVRINESKKYIGFETDSLRDAISCSLEMLGVDKLQPAESNGRFVFPNLDVRHRADPTWSSTLDILRTPPKDGKRSFQWRKDSPIRPIVFNPPNGIDDSVVQLHLCHRITQRLLGRFISQGFVHHDLSRACLAQSSDAIPRAVLLGRLSLYGKGAVRLHEEILTITSKWTDPSIRKTKLSPYGKESELKTLELLEDSLKHGLNSIIPAPIQQKLLGSIARDIEELLPHLYNRGEEAKEEAIKKLIDRGKIESDGMLKTLEDQKKRVATEFGKTKLDQLSLGLDEAEKRQLESNRKYWQKWLANVDSDIRVEPARILEFYKVTSFRIEPIGIGYLWPVTG